METLKALLRTLAGNVRETNERLGQESQEIVQRGWRGASPTVRKNVLNRGMAAAGTTSTPAKLNSPKMMLDKLRRLSQKDRSIMGQFGEMVEQSGRQNMGRVGQDAQVILEGLGGRPEWGNQRVASFFNEMLEMADKNRLGTILEGLRRIDLTRR